MLSLGYFSLHEQREVTRSCEAGVKARPSSFRFHTCPEPIELLGYHLGLRSCRLEKPSKGWSRIKKLSLPFGARATFLCSCKERWPKEALFNSRMAGQHTPAYAPDALRAPGPLRRRDFSTRHPCLVEKRRASLHVALRVIPTGSVATEGDPESQKLKSNSQSRLYPVTRRRFARACASYRSWKKSLKKMRGCASTPFRNRRRLSRNSKPGTLPRYSSAMPRS